MSRRLRYLDWAVADLDSVRRWQEQPGSGAKASNRLKRIRNAIRRLKDSPCLYPFGDHPGIRELSCEGHRVMYIVDPDTGSDDDAGDVLVLRVFGPGQSRDAL